MDCADRAGFNTECALQTFFRMVGQDPVLIHFQSADDTGCGTGATVHTALLIYLNDRNDILNVNAALFNKGDPFLNVIFCARNFKKQGTVHVIIDKGL